MSVDMDHKPITRKIEDLDWSDGETLETYLRFIAFAHDWNKGMEAYDDEE